MRILALRRSAAMLAASGLLAAASTVATAPLASRAVASGAPYYFHGTAADEANKTAPPGTATFNTIAPNVTTPVTQTTSPFANRDLPGNALAAYWSGAFSGTVSGDMQLNWYWSTSNAEAALLGLDMDMAIFGAPNFSTGTGTILGRSTVHLNVGAAPTLNISLVPVGGSVTSTLLVQAVPHFSDTGQGALVYYDATSTPSSFSFVAAPTSPPVVLDRKSV